MFLGLVMKRNPQLLETAIKLHRSGLIQPDTYVLDLDAIIKNAGNIKAEADKYGIKLYFMTKQFGRNPYIAGELAKLGYDGAVAVDYREANVLYENGIKLGNVGHLVQMPSAMVGSMIRKSPEIITVYSIEKAREISDAAKRLNVKQDIMLRVVDDGDIIFSGQYGGFKLKEFADSMKQLLTLPNIVINGITSFPCFTVDSHTRSIVETNNLKTILKARQIMQDRFDITPAQINMPSVTCTSNVKKIFELGGTHGEPGHGLLGTTPIHALKDQVEAPAVVYVSEISHNMDKRSYCYGGGFYRRSSMAEALVGKSIETMKTVNIDTPSDTNIDYYIGLQENADVGETVVCSFRTQIFVTRSEVAVIRGISSGIPQIVGTYDNLGRLLRGGV